MCCSLFLIYVFLDVIVRVLIGSDAMVMAPQPPREFTAEELEPLEHWFESCNGAQQATIAVKLLSRANPKAAHLIHSFLQQQLLVANAIWRQEIQRANDPGKNKIVL